MVEWDTLLYWLSHIASGSWARFRQILRHSAEPDKPYSPGTLTLARICLSDLAHVDFFVNDTKTWMTRPPVFTGLPGFDDAFLLSGGRSPALLRTIEAATKQFDIGFVCDSSRAGPSRIMLVGHASQVEQCAAAAGIGFVDCLAYSLCTNMHPIIELADSLDIEELPDNWQIKSFDFDLLQWVDDKLPRTAYLCTSRFNSNIQKTYVHLKGKVFLRVSRRDSVYLAAAIHGHSIIQYDSRSRILYVPRSAPLPVLHARVACLSSGTPAKASGDVLVYHDVTAELADFLLVSLGQVASNSLVIPVS